MGECRRCFAVGGRECKFCDSAGEGEELGVVNWIGCARELRCRGCYEFGACGGEGLEGGFEFVVE